MSRTVDITKDLSDEDANYLLVHERTADINRAKTLGTWPEGAKLASAEPEAEEPASDPGNTDVPEQGENESNGEYAHRLTVPQLREVIAAYGNEEEVAEAPAAKATKGEVKAHVVLILDRIDRENTSE